MAVWLLWNNAFMGTALRRSHFCGMIRKKRRCRHVQGEEKEKEQASENAAAGAAG
jgi:hypothetical protein